MSERTKNRLLALVFIIVCLLTVAACLSYPPT